MRARIFGELYSQTLPGGMAELPIDPCKCCVDVMADIGPLNSPGGEMFTFRVCTIRMLEELFRGDRYIYGHGLIIVRQFDWTVVKAAIQKIVSMPSADNWSELATKIAKHSQWEFDDYTTVID